MSHLVTVNIETVIEIDLKYCKRIQNKLEIPDDRVELVNKSILIENEEMKDIAIHIQF